MLAFILLPTLLVSQSRGKSLEDYLKAVPADTKTGMTEAIERAVKASATVKNPDHDLIRLGMELDAAVKKHPWAHRMPVLTAALKGRQGHGASVLLHVLAVRALTDGIFFETEIDDFRVLSRIAIEAVAPFVQDKEASARLMAVSFLKAEADAILLGNAEQKKSLHAPETRALIRKALVSASKDANERISRWAKEGLESLDSVEK